MLLCYVLQILATAFHLSIQSSACFEAVIPLLLSICHASTTGVFNDLRVLVQRPLAHFQRRGLPLFPSPLPLFFRDICYINGVLDGVDSDDVTVLDERDRATDLGLWYDVPDNESVGSVRYES